MKARFYAGTDAGAIGAWDASRNAHPIATADALDLPSLLESDAAAGQLFLINTHSDGGGPAEVYVDEPVPTELTDYLTLLPGEFLLELPTGALIVDGVEFYRSSKPSPGLAKPILHAPPGEYAVRCYVDKGDDDAIIARGSEDDLEAAVGAEELAYYDRTNKLGCLAGILTPLVVFPLLWLALGWKIALTITAVVVLSFFHIRERVLKRNARYSRLRDVVTAYRLGSGEPQIVLALRKVSDRGNLRGGSVSIGDDE